MVHPVLSRLAELARGGSCGYTEDDLNGTARSAIGTAQLAKGETHASNPFAGGRRSRAPPGQCRAKLISDAGLVRDHFFEALEVGHHRSLVDHSDLADDRRAIGEDA